MGKADILNLLFQEHEAAENPVLSRNYFPDLHVEPQFSQSAEPNTYINQARFANYEETPELAASYELKAAPKRTIRNYLGDVAAEGMRSIGLREKAGQIRRDTKAAVDFVPIIGDAVAIEDGNINAAKGNPVLAAIDYATSVPILGDAALVSKAIFAGIGAKTANKAMLKTAKKMAKKSVAPKGIRAFHGSPHSFDKFTMDTIGTGEGAQAYGHGLYFAESEGVARSYRESITRNIEQLQKIAKDEGLSKDASELLAFQFSSDDFHGKGFNSWLDEMKANETRGWTSPRSQKAINEIIEMDVEASSAVARMKDPGSMYEVNIKANPDDFLDWDKLVGEQSENVQRELGITPEMVAQKEALESRLIDFDPMKDADPFTDQEWERLKSLRLALESDAGDIYNNRLNWRDKANLKDIHTTNIPGIKYLDGSSRAAGEGSRNYVVFDEEKIEIVRKFGIAGAISLGLISHADGEAMAAQINAFKNQSQRGAQ